MEKIKLSWSIISAWSAGRKDDAIKMFMGMDTGNMYTREGSRIHDKIAKAEMRLIPQIKDTAIFEGVDENRAERKNYFRTEVYEWLDMSMIIDVLDIEEKLIIDWKSGRRKSTQHNKMQLFVYAYLLSLQGIEIDKAIIAKVEESVEGVVSCSDYSAYKINEEKLMLAENYIESNASEIYNFLQEARDGRKD